jgi:cell division septation protein DedD
MSFRFVTTALGILGSTTATGLYLVSGTPAMTDGPITPPAAVIVPVEKPPAAKPAMPPVREAAPVPSRPVSLVPPSPPVMTASGATRRVWVYPGAVFNPWTGEPLTNEERESGWLEVPLPMPAASPLMAASAVSEPVAVPPAAMAPMAPPAVAPAEAPAAPAKTTRRRAVAPTAAAPPAAAAAPSSYTIHLASYRSEAGARSGWRALQSRFGQELAGLEPTMVRVRVAGKGRVVRLLAGPFPNAAAADNACAGLKTQHLFCHTVAPGATG